MSERTVQVRVTLHQCQRCRKALVVTNGNTSGRVEMWTDDAGRPMATPHTQHCLGRPTDDGWPVP